MFTRIILLVLLLTQVQLSNSQELRAKVSIDVQQLTSIEKSRFDKMKTQIEEFLNFTKWTKDIFGEEEKINCSVNIILNNVSKSNTFSGSIYVLSSRPAYGSAYNSTTFKMLDKDVSIIYDEFSVIEYTETNFQSNLGSLLAYYAYMIIGSDYDSFSPLGGTAYFEQAMNIVRNAQGQDDYKGWNSTEGNSNRFWMVENILDSKYEPLREFSFQLHHQVLDQMSSNSAQALAQFHSELMQIENLKYFSSSFFQKSFFEFKSNEINNLAKSLSLEKQKELKPILSGLSPLNNNLWTQLGKDKSSETNKNGLDPFSKQDQNKRDQTRPMSSQNGQPQLPNQIRSRTR
ncbi:MAG: DUF4835 family protein [Flavobacteriales bacterium]